jgi:hypothetical protein
MFLCERINIAINYLIITNNESPHINDIRENIIDLTQKHAYIYVLHINT